MTGIAIPNLLILLLPMCFAGPCDIDKGTPIGMMDDIKMEEASGLAVSEGQPGILWTHNDHGGAATVFAISKNGERLADVELEGIDNIDWEDIALHKINGESFIYVADTGNNDFDRENLRIIRFKEPSVNRNGPRKTIIIKQEDIEILQVKYPGYNHDSEALAVDPLTGDIYLFTKDRVNNISEVYRYPSPQTSLLDKFTLELVVTLPLFWITGADISPDGQFLALTNKQVAFAWRLPEDWSWYDYLTSSPKECLLQLQEEEQRESIAVTNTGYWTTSECKDSPPCPLWNYLRL